MTRKTLLLMALLAPATFVSYGNALDPQIQALKGDRLKKQLELSELGKAIDEKDDLVRNLPPLSSLVNYWIENVIKKNEEASKLNEQEFEELRQTLVVSLTNFQKTLDETIIVKQNVKQFFVKELVNKRNQNEDYFNTLKFAVIRNALEHDLLNTLVEQYEYCQQELIEINRKLADLQK